MVDWEAAQRNKSEQQVKYASGYLAVVSVGGRKATHYYFPFVEGIPRRTLHIINLSNKDLIIARKKNVSQDDAQHVSAKTSFESLLQTGL